MYDSVSECPYCGANQQSGSQSEFRTCHLCGEIYVDGISIEPAFEQFKRQSALGRIAYGIYEAVFISLSICLTVQVACLIVAGKEIMYDPVFLFVFFGMLIALSIALGRKELKGFCNEENARLKAWKESEARLKNRKYAMSLKKAGYPVPEKYLIADRDGNAI